MLTKIHIVKSTTQTYKYNSTSTISTSIHSHLSTQLIVCQKLPHLILNCYKSIYDSCKTTI